MVLMQPDFEVGARVYLIGQQQPYRVTFRKGNWVELHRWARDGGTAESPLAPPVKVHVDNLEMRQ